jgi:endonuclease G
MKKLVLFSLFLGLILIIIILLVSVFRPKDKQEEETYTTMASSEDKLFSNNIDFVYLYTGRSSIHAPFGYPQDQDTLDDFIIEKPQYILSYCGVKNSPNWVAWELNENWVGNAPRMKGRFIQEPHIPDSFYSVKHENYTNSGYDRGHLVRSKERTRTTDDNMRTFEMGNIIPQTPDLNRGVWLRFEDYCMDKALKEKKNMFIVAGGIYHDTITLNHQGKILIPDSCFKIVLFANDTSIDKIEFHKLDRICVAMPNTAGIRGDDWKKYITTLEKIENSTGYRFFGKMQ